MPQKIEITETQCRAICAFLANVALTPHQYDASYPSWSRGGSGWQRRLCYFGGTDILRALAWYQHIHCPGSKEWRPSVIIRALLAQIPPSTASG